MEKKMTAMQELIAELKATRKNCLPEFDLGIAHAILQASSLLPKEREQIEEAFNDGYIDGSAELSEGVHPQYKSASDYFTQTYQQ